MKKAADIMNDPHVETLYYDFVSENLGDRFDQAAPLTASLGHFVVKLEAGTLKARPIAHYPDEESAKADFEPFLRSWESAASLSESRFRIRFVYRKAEMIDRNPDPDSVTVSVRVSDAVITAERITVVRDMFEFPAPDPTFRASPFTDELISRLKRYRDGRMLLTTLAYWVLTKLENEYGNGNRIEACKKLQVSKRVLQTLGELSSSTDPEHGRKAKGQGPAVLSSAELQWLDFVVDRLIIRVGEVNVGSMPTKITMKDLPQI